jgi:thioredoxin-like negative regulator of GroEL
LRAGDLNGARVPLGQAAELAPENGRVLANMAVLLLVEGDPVKAQRLMDQAQLGDEARGQVQRLASEIRGQLAPAPLPAASLPATRVSSGAGPAMPMMSPLMEGLGNGPIVR